MIGAMHDPDIRLMEVLLESRGGYLVHPDEHAEKMPFTADQLREMGYHYYRVFADGEVWAVSPYSIGNGRMFMDIHGWGYGDFYCFCDFASSLKALINYQPCVMPEPFGWHRHFKTSRRRDGGDPKTEYIWA
jgi:hypothetical protein